MRATITAAWAVLMLVLCATASAKTPAALSPATAAAADAVCLQSASAQADDALGVEQALSAYVAGDSAATRSALAGALSGFFLTRWQELGALESLRGSASQRAALVPFETDTWLLVATAKPFVDAVRADESTLVEAFAAEIASLANRSGTAAAHAGLFVCGAGRGYVVRVRIPGRTALTAGAPVSLRRGGRTVAHAGEVLTSRVSGGKTTALVALAATDAPLHAATTAALLGVGRSRAIALTDGPSAGRTVAFDGLISLS